MLQNLANDLGFAAGIAEAFADSRAAQLLEDILEQDWALFLHFLWSGSGVAAVFSLIQIFRQRETC